MERECECERSTVDRVPGPLVAKRLLYGPGLLGIPNYLIITLTALVAAFYPCLRITGPDQDAYLVISKRESNSEVLWHIMALCYLFTMVPLFIDGSLNLLWHWRCPWYHRSTPHVPVMAMLIYSLGLVFFWVMVRNPELSSPDIVSWSPTLWTLSLSAFIAVQTACYLLGVLGAFPRLLARKDTCEYYENKPPHPWELQAPELVHQQNKND